MARVLNNVQLDNGYCGHNLRIGSDPKASTSNKPSFVLYGDGGLSKYTVKISSSLRSGTSVTVARESVWRSKSPSCVTMRVAVAGS